MPTSVWKDKLLELRLTAMADAQRRARVALLVTSLASGAILVAEWNSYLSWDRQWADTLNVDRNSGQGVLLEQQIKSWVDTNGVNLALVGLRVSVSDAAVLGSGILLMLAFYLCMTARRENDEIGSTLVDVRNEPIEVRRLVFEQIRSSAIFTQTGDDDAPIDDLFRKRRHVRIPLARAIHGLLTFLPALTVFGIVLSDLYFACCYLSPWSGTSYLPGFLYLPWQYQIQLTAMIAFASIFGGIIVRLCWLARRYQSATQQIVSQFRERLTGEDPHPAPGPVYQLLARAAIVLYVLFGRRA